MKTIKINWINDYSPRAAFLYPSANPTFSWLSSKVKGAYEQSTAWHTCRETFCTALGRVSGAKWKPNTTERPLNVRKLRIAVLRKHASTLTAKARKKEIDNDLRWMKESVRLLNLMEKNLGWSLTRVYKCVDQDYVGGPKLSADDTHVYVFFGSAKWLRSPQLLSLYMLNIRLGRLFKETAGYKKLSGLSKLNDKLEKNAYKYKGQVKSDIKWFTKTYKWWETVLDNHKVLFFDRPLRENYRLNDGVNGINELVRGNADRSIKNKWNKIIRSAEKG